MMLAAQKIRLFFACVVLTACVPFAAAALSAPTVVVTAQAPTQITALWYGDVWGVTSERDGVALSTYAVTIAEKKSGSVVATLSTEDSSATFSGLQPNTAYTIQVSMVRGDEVSDDRVQVVRTLPKKVKKLSAATVSRQLSRDVIGNSPLNQFGDASSSKWIAKLTWDKPSGKIRYYTVNVYNAQEQRVATKKTKKRVAGISGLKLNRTYSYEVVSHFNDENASDASSRKKFRLEKKY